MYVADPSLPMMTPLASSSHTVALMAVRSSFLEKPALLSPPQHKMTEAVQILSTMDLQKGKRDTNSENTVLREALFPVPQLNLGHAIRKANETE
jgi:hypothetical protein